MPSGSPAAAADGGGTASGDAPHRLQPDDFQAICAAWQAACLGTPQERNKLLAKRLKEAASGDPWAYDLVKSDARDYM